LALELCRIFFLNWYNVQAVYESYRAMKVRNKGIHSA